MKELESILERAQARLDPEDYRKLKALVETFLWLSAELQEQDLSVAQLRTLLFGTITTEKTRRVLAALVPQGEHAEGNPASASGEHHRSGTEPTKPQGHGRNGAAAYVGAQRIAVRHPTLHPGACCPNCPGGKVYRQGEPRVLVRVRGQAPLQAELYECETYRCHLCGTVFPAPAPAGVGAAKYDASAASMIALLKYGSGLPFARLERLEGTLGIPLPAPTQWEIVAGAAAAVAPAYQELIRQGAQGEVLYHDDTAAKILALMKENPERLRQDPAARTGMFTTGIVAKTGDHQIALFFTGRQHAGENLAEMLKQRAQELEPPIKMSDGSSRNDPEELEAVLANCLAHGRRKFVELAGSFPAECRHVLERLGEVYQHEAATRQHSLSADERLAYHQTHSGPVMEELERWMAEQIVARKVEPNAPLGHAIRYLQRRWDKLTLFLRKPGAPLDNNVVERALKKVVLHRKNALFFKTENGARVGDIFMTLIHTAELADANPFDYLTELQQHADQLRRHPQDWLPWNYRETIARPARASPG